VNALPRKTKTLKSNHFWLRLLQTVPKINVENAIPIFKVSRLVTHGFTSQWS